MLAKSTQQKTKISLLCVSNNIVRVNYYNERKFNIVSDKNLSIPFIKKLNLLKS